MGAESICTQRQPRQGLATRGLPYVLVSNIDLLLADESSAVLCDERYGEYKPILQEIERIQQEAEVEAEDAKKTGGKASEGNRNRR